jgi:hypothetical protein
VTRAALLRQAAWPDLQVLQVTRKRRDPHTNRWQTVTVYAITRLPFELARPRPLPAPRAWESASDEPDITIERRSPALTSEDRCWTVVNR